MAEEYFFRGTPVSFEQAFPEIEDVQIEATEGSMGAGPSKMVLNKNSLGISCSNRVCEKGGYVPGLGDFISEMYHKKETSKDGLIRCKGYESMGRGNQPRKCLNGMSIKVKIKYKTPVS